MDLKSDYYPYLEVNGKSADTIFRELCNNEAYRQIEDGSWKETFVNRFGEMLAEMPDVRSVANRILREGLLAKGYDIDPEKVYYNIFTDYTRSGNDIYHTGPMLKESYRLTDAALLNVFEKYYGGSYYILESWRVSGVYTVGKEGSVNPANPSFGRCWGPHNQAVLPIEPANILLASAGIQAEFTKAHNAYWSKYADLYRDMMADFFLAAAIKQYKDGLLSDYGFSMARKVYDKQPSVVSYYFNINTYTAYDIIVMESRDSGRMHTILYIPGASIPFKEFDNVTQMKTWIGRQLADPAAQGALLQHFSIYNRQDGPTYIGVGTILRKMAAGDSQWNPQTHILVNPGRAPYDAVFDKLRDQVRSVMHNNAEKLVTTNAEVYRAFALSLVETFLQYTALVELVMPKAGFALNLVLSLTALGLSADIAIKGDSLKERMDGVGSLVNSALNIALNMLPIFKEIGLSLKVFRRAADEILPFADETKFMMNTFQVDSPSALNRIRPGDAPLVVNHATGELRLVRLADGGESLAVLRRVGGNKFARLNPATLEELPGERLISEVFSEKIARRTVYLSGSLVRGGAPYNPWENFFDQVWTVEELKRKADKLGTSDRKYTDIKNRLAQMHVAADFDAKQLAAHHLLYQVADYARTYPSALRRTVLNQLAAQIKEVLYPPEIAYLRRRLVESAKGMHPAVASRIYKVSIAERLGEVPDGLTLSLIRYAENDPVLSILSLSPNPQRVLPAEGSSSAKYVIYNITDMNRLDVNYATFPPYTSLDIYQNHDVFRYALTQSQKLGLLTKIKLVRNIYTSVVIGYSYDELLSLVTEFSSSASSRFGTYPLTVVNLLRDMAKRGGEGEMMRLYGRNKYFDDLVQERLGNMEKNIRLYDASMLESFDRNVAKAFDPHFDSLTHESQRLAKIMENLQGMVVRQGIGEIAYCLRNLDYFKSKGVTHIGLTSLFADVHQAELTKFMEGGFLTATLEAMILTADKGVADGPLLRLLTAARGKGMKAVALGHSDTALHSLVDGMKNAYTKGVVVRNAGRLLAGTKTLIVADPKLINTTPGLSTPSMGIAQVLEIPAFYYDLSKNELRYFKDIVSNRAPLYAGRESDWLSLSPTPGRFMGWRVYGSGYTHVTPAQRRNSVYAKISSDLNAFKREYEEIYNLVSDVACGQGRRCDKVMADVNAKLTKAGKRLGTGRSLTWWHPSGSDYGTSSHTASTVYIRDVEYVVDASHLQFPHHSLDEGVMIMPADDWAEELMNRVKGQNPYLAFRAHAGDSLRMFTGPDFTRPRVRKS